MQSVLEWRPRLLTHGSKTSVLHPRSGLEDRRRPPMLEPTPAPVPAIAQRRVAPWSFPLSLRSLHPSRPLRATAHSLSLLTSTRTFQKMSTFRGYNTRNSSLCFMPATPGISIYTRPNEMRKGRAVHDQRRTRQRSCGKYTTLTRIPRRKNAKTWATELACDISLSPIGSRTSVALRRNVRRKISLLPSHLFRTPVRRRGLARSLRSRPPRAPPILHSLFHLQPGTHRSPFHSRTPFLQPSLYPVHGDLPVLLRPAGFQTTRIHSILPLLDQLPRVLHRIGHHHLIAMSHGSTVPAAHAPSRTSLRLLKNSSVGPRRRASRSAVRSQW